MEWVNHIHEYVHLFESPGMQKVVDISGFLQAYFYLVLRIGYDPT